MTNSPEAMHGAKYSDLEFEDKAFLRSVRRAGLARVVAGYVQIRQASDIGYDRPYAEALSLAPLVVRGWFAA